MIPSSAQEQSTISDPGIFPWRNRTFLFHLIILLAAFLAVHFGVAFAIKHLPIHLITPLPFVIELLAIAILLTPLLTVLFLRPFVNEITNRRIAVNALRESEASLRTILNNVYDAIALHDLQGAIVYVNTPLLTMYGITEEDLARDNSILRYSIPNAQAEQLRVIWDTVCAGQHQLFEWKAYRPHRDEVFDVEVYLGKVTLHGDDLILASIRDITERKRVQQALAESEADFRAIFFNAGIGIAMTDPDGILINSNPTLCRMLSYSCEELAGLTFREITHPDDEASDAQLYQELVDGKRNSYSMEKRYQAKDGSIRWGNLTVSTIRTTDGQMRYAVKIIEDITDRKSVEDQLRLVAKVIDNTVEGVTITTPDSTIISVNPAFTSITGYTAEEVIGQTPRILKSDRHDSEFYQQMWRSIVTTGHWQGEIWNRRKSGEAYPEWLTISAIHDEQGRLTHYVAVFHDITEIKQNEAQIKYQAYHDALTGLPNRQLFNDRLGHSLAHAQRNNQLVAVFFLDLDRFKTINDTLGHLVGDHLLQAVATRLTTCVRNDDTVARLGGDEFTILVTDLDYPEDAMSVAKKVIDAFRRPFIVDGHELFSTPSIGISIYPMDGAEAEALMKNADTALYRAKEQGRNNYQLYTPAMNEAALERLELENELRRALERKEFLLHYQPRVDIETNTVESMEALLRWQHPKQGLLSPDTFIPLAEETGLIIPIGEWVLHTACAQNKAWQDAGYPARRVAVNLSARQFEQDTLVQMVAGVLRDTGLDAHYLELEITETAAMKQGEKGLAMLQELSALGIHLSIDDFGTGYSSFSYLKKFPVHALKIDQSFVRDIPQDQDDMAITTAVIVLAHTLNLQVIAEGVESAEQLAFLQQHACDEVQGYLFSKPLPADEYARHFLKEANTTLA